ncbi:DedA family protein [Halomonas sp. McH1-25]|uniref:YqaA family protein n=1 Tax=unclassified Halomonas TaxID=2609666 RepID=UPI001EF3DFBC|nr:DedA family protein [Halomonas sp. McH1-25]MCP1343827.1 DedA family protein [Halomonas sp. FL8]MCP1361128.1 DedA family protein [Halomonas sp. BBD45]MCP1363835.1 DedA family protein [Halomonas sp. BBD48]
MTGYFGLFTSSFLAATLLPFYSEVLLAGLFRAGYEFWLLLAVATAGNTLGAAVNWALGRYLEHYKDRRWFPFKEKKLGHAQRWFNRFGVWSLLLAWLPVGGDALTFIAGLLRVSFPIFFVLTAIGKGARYLVVLLAMQQF